MLKTPELFSNPGTIRYKTIESSEESPRIAKYKYKYNNTIQGNRKINNIKNIEKQYVPKIKHKKFIKKNGINDITLSSIPNNSSIENNNITIGTRSNVTNNVCIIINNTEKNESIDNINNKNTFQDISFAEKDNNDINNNNSYINMDNNIETIERS